MKSDMSGASEKPRILDEKDENENIEELEGPSLDQNETVHEDEEILEIETEWIHPKDRPTVTKEKRKANQKLVKEQQVTLLLYL